MTRTREFRYTKQMVHPRMRVSQIRTLTLPHIKLLHTAVSRLAGFMDEKFVAYPDTRSFDAFRQHYLKAFSDSCLDFHGTVKLHGANVSIIFKSTNSWHIQSRNRILSSEEDMCECYAKLNNAPLSQMAQKISQLAGTSDGSVWDDIMVAGEWAGNGIQKGVGVNNVDKFFAIFNIRVGNKWQDIRKFRTVALPEHRIFNICDFPTYDMRIDLLSSKDMDRAEKEMQTLVEEIDKKCPVAAQLGVEGCGEGIVYTFYPPEPSTCLLHFKVKGPSHQIVRREKLCKVPPGLSSSIAAFIEYAVTEARLDQGITYLEEMNIPIEDESTGKYIGWVVKDVFKEETHTMEKMGLKEKDVKSQLSKTVREGWKVRLKAAQRKDLE